MKRLRIVLGIAVLSLFAAMAVFAPNLAPYNPVDVGLRDAEQPPSYSHLFGTDYLGRDVFSMVVYGSRVSLLVGLMAAVVSVGIGTSVGLVAGYYGGYMDSLLMRIVDVVYSLPQLILLVVIMSMFERSVWSVVAVIGLTQWMSTARLVRSETLSLKSQSFVEATVAIGASDFYIIFRHLLPNVFHLAVVAVTLTTATSIMTESMLSFLGLGIPPHEPSWGNMLTDSQRDIMYGIWWTTLFPGFMIVLTVLAINFLGNGLKDMLLPRKDLKANL